MARRVVLAPLSREAARHPGSTTVARPNAIGHGPDGRRAEASVPVRHAEPRCPVSWVSGDARDLPVAWAWLELVSRPRRERGWSPPASSSDAIHARGDAPVRVAALAQRRRGLLRLHRCTRHPLAVGDARDRGPTATGTPAADRRGLTVLGLWSFLQGHGARRRLARAIRTGTALWAPGDPDPARFSGARARPRPSPAGRAIGHRRNARGAATA
jgi:hypothetical protein